MRKYPVIPVKSEVVFPSAEAVIAVSRTRSVAAVHRAQAMTSGYVVVVLQSKINGKKEIENPDITDLCYVGTLCRIEAMTDHGNSLNVNLVGEMRVSLERNQIMSEDGHEWLETETKPLPDELSKNHISVNGLLLKVDTLSKMLQQESIYKALVADFISKKIELSGFLDQIGSYLEVDVKEKQKILEETSLSERIKLLMGLVSTLIEQLTFRQETERKAKEKIFKENRRGLIREQLRILQKEMQDLGEEGPVPVNPGDEFVQKIKAAKLPKDVKRVSEEELKKLEMLHPSSSEYNVVRNYLEWIVSMPWDKASKDNIDLKLALGNLNEDHFGLDKAKKRIIEFLAISKLKNNLKGPIICLAGPPGIGKTSLGKSIARSLNRKFARISLGGVRDEAEIRGHRRTYVGAMPGKIIQTLKRLGTNNPVILLDEIDKMGKGHQGDPGAAMLEVLDPEQNLAFNDHYLDLPIDLSNVLFICTANYLEDIPAPLRDRMEIINLAGYTSNEKKHIALKHLLPEQVLACGLKLDQVQMGTSEVELLINHYTREAGVRELQRTLNAVLRGAAQEILAGKTPVIITVDKIREYLGPEKYHAESALTSEIPGIATGLAWTPVGGEILFTEAVKVEGGSGQLFLTGSLGDVMKESANVALTYLKSAAPTLGLTLDKLKHQNFYVHLPAGAVPKDGPSAGITLATTLLSLLKEQAIPKDLAMSGELSLTGQVLPVGGIKEKVIAAHRAGIKTLILPAANEVHYQEVPTEVRDELTVHFIKTFPEVLKIVFKNT